MQSKPIKKLHKYRYVMFCAILYHLCNSRKREKHPRSSVTFSKSCRLQTYCIFTKSSTPPLVLFTFLKFYKWYLIAQSVSYLDDGYFSDLFPLRIQDRFNYSNLLFFSLSHCNQSVADLCKPVYFIQEIKSFCSA